MSRFSPSVPFSFLLLLILPSGCTYHGVIEQRAQPAMGLARGNLPIRVAILQSKTTPFVASGGGQGVEIDYSEALAKSLEGSFSTIFEKARLIQGPQDSSKEELLAPYDSRYREIARDDWSGRYVSRFKFTVQFMDPDSKVTIAEFDHTEDIHYSPSAESMASSFLTGASLFLLSPITIPWNTSAAGRKAMRLLGQTIQNSVEAISAKIPTDPRLAAYAGSRKTDPPSGPAVASPVRPEAAPQPPSKYEDFLNSVVVVRSSKGLGSGFFIGPRGLVVTNHHVVGSDSSVVVKLRNGRIAMGNPLAYDEDSDLALISVPIEPQKCAIGSTLRPAPRETMVAPMTKSRNLHRLELADLGQGMSKG